MKILSLSLVALASAPSVLAQAVTTNTDVPGATRAKSILDAILTAGPVMFVLIAMSIFSIMLVVVRVHDSRRYAVAVILAAGHPVEGIGFAGHRI